MRKSPDLDSILGFDESIAPVEFEVGFPMDAAQLLRFVRDNPSIARNEEFNCGICSSCCSDFPHEEEYRGTILDACYYCGAETDTSELELYEERWNGMWPGPTCEMFSNPETRACSGCFESVCICEHLYVDDRD